MTSSLSGTTVARHGRIPLAQAIGRRFASIVGVDPVNAVMVRQLLEAMDWDHGCGDAFIPLSTYLTFAMPAYRRAGEPLRAGCYPPFPYQSVEVPGNGRIAISVGVSVFASADARPSPYLRTSAPSPEPPPTNRSAPIVVLVVATVTPPPGNGANEAVWANVTASV